MAILLIEPAQTTSVIMLRVDGASALEARLSKTLVEALAQAPSRDLRVEFPAEPRIPETLEGRVRPPAVREQVGGDAIVRIFGASCYGRIYVS